ncbi:hypothetical protein C0J52_16776 [Blattella germanica]|nr:hypothetical protein C0J52_16776 [Blattella germanica]
MSGNLFGKEKEIIQILEEEEEGELNLFDSTDEESETEDNVEEIISDNENDGNQSTPVPQQPTAGTVPHHSSGPRYI